MIGKNELDIIGNVGSVDLTHTTTGIAKLRFTVAVGSRWKDANGVVKEKTQWFSCILWGKRGEGMGKILEKGKGVSVTGPHESHEWMDRDGVKRVAWALNVRDMLLLPDGKRGERGAATAGDATADEPGIEVIEHGFVEGAEDDDIPF